MGGWNLLPSSGLIIHKKGSSEYFYKRPNQTWPKAVGTLKKNQNNTPTRTQKRARYKLFRYMLIVFYPLSVPLLFLKEGNKITKKLSRGSIFKNISRGNQKGEGRGNAKVIERCNFFIFIFSLLAMMVTGTVFRKASLENLFLKNGPWNFYIYVLYIYVYIYIHILYIKEILMTNKWAKEEKLSSKFQRHIFLTLH